MSGRSRATTFLGCGCAAALALFLAGALSVTFLSYRAGQRLERQVQDPVVAARDVRRVLPYDELPPGYRPLGALSVPLTFDLAMVMGPAEGTADGGGDRDYDRGFLYVRVRDWLGRGDRTRRWIESGQGDEAPLEQEQIDFAPREVVGRGTLASGRAEITWVARRGEVQVKVGHDGDAAEGGDAPSAGAPASAGVLTLMDVECPGDARYERVAIWFAPDPSPETSAGEQDWTGTPADPEALAEMLARFDLCA